MESKAIVPQPFAGQGAPRKEVFRTVEYSADYLAEIAGEEALEGARLQAGPLLKLLYDTGVSVALRHSERRPVLLRLDRIDLTRRIRHMDLVRVEGRLIEVGHSSMVIEARCSARSPGEREFRSSHLGFVTMVALDSEGQPSRDIPRLSYDSPGGPEARALAAHRREELSERRQALEWIDQADIFRSEDVVESDPVPRYDRIRPEETLVQVKGQLISQSTYFDGRVKGGDLIQWLERLERLAIAAFYDDGTGQIALLQRAPIGHVAFVGIFLERRTLAFARSFDLTPSCSRYSNVICICCAGSSTFRSSRLDNNSPSGFLPVDIS